MSTLNKNDAPIGFFDSGVGGLTVLNKVKKLLPNESIVFYGDTVHVPYGEKTKEQLIEYSAPILKFFENKGCKAVVMACNTTSSLIYEDIKNSYNFKLFPIVQSVGKILAQFDVKRIGVFGTKATIESAAYEREINKYNKNIKVFGHYCKDWVHIVENGLINDSSSIDIVKYDFEKLMEYNPELIVLGCTHYPYLLSVLSQFAPASMFFDPSEAVAKSVQNTLNSLNLLSKSDSPFSDFYVSSNPEKFKESAKIFYTLEKAPELLNF